MKIMVVDDELVALRTMERLIRRRRLGQCVLCDSGTQALENLEDNPVDVVLLDLMMPDINGLQVLEQARPLYQKTEFIVITAQDDINLAVKAIRLGAYDFLVKPVDPERLILSIERAYEKLSMRMGLEAAVVPTALPEAFSNILTTCRCMREQLAYAVALARSYRPVLVCGATGTGKELVARGIHNAGPRAAGPFVPVNVSAVPESLFESQFFGHCKGAFTGAGSDHKGYFQQAHGGTLFLDELGELPMHLQAKLLRVLEDNMVIPLGGSEPITVDVGIVSATNRDLDQACADGLFRIDLLYRLRTACVTLPPLAERQGDVALLARHFLKETCLELDRPDLELTPEDLSRLEAYDFPGNVRELSQIIYSAVLHSTGSRLEIDAVLPRADSAGSLPRKLCSLKENEAQHVAYVLQSTRGDLGEAARILGIGLRQVQRKLAVLKKDPQWATLLGDK